MSLLHRVRAMGAACVVAAATVALPAAAVAQQAAPTVVPAGPLTLDQVLDLAVGRSETVAIAQTGIRRAEGEQVRARSGLFPQISLSGGYDRALASEFSGLFDNVGGSTADATDGNLSDLPFGRANTWRLSLAFSQNIYSGGSVGLQRQLATFGHETARQGLTTARAQLLYDATQAYYDAALADRLVAIAEATVQQAGATLQQVQAGFAAGTQPEFEVLRARVNRDNQQPVLIRQRMNREIALLRVKQLLDLPADADLRLADALSDDLLPPPPVFATRVVAIEQSLVTRTTAASSAAGGGAAADRTVVNEAETVVKQRETALKLTEAARKPTVSLNSTYTRVGYPADDELPKFDRTNWTVSANVQVPLFTGGRQRGDELVARADVDDAKLRLQQMKELATLDSQSAMAELLAARAVWEASAGTVQQATRAYEIADVRYRNGVSTQLELTDSRLLLQQAEANRAVAARDLQVARARVALIPDLPLSATAATAARPTSVPTTPQAPSQQPSTATGQVRTASAQGAQGQTGTR